jgi:hypothetical protein
MQYPARPCRPQVCRPLFGSQRQYVVRGRAPMRGLLRTLRTCISVPAMARPST